MEDTNGSDSVRVVREILPGDTSYILREINQEDIDPNLFSSGPLITAESFPTIPYPLLNPAADLLDRLWTQTVITINYEPSDKLQENES